MQRTSHSITVDRRDERDIGAAEGDFRGSLAPATTTGEDEDNIEEENSDDTTGTADVPRWAMIPIHNPEIHPPLPVDATVQNYRKHLEAAKDDNTLDEFNKSSTPMRQRDKEARRIIGIARLMRDDYGVTASTPCDHCVKNRHTCRVFHPIMFTEDWYAVNKHWQPKKYGRRACAHCMISSTIRKFCNAV